MLVGVVPPPTHGQSIATQALFDADLHPLEKVIVEIRSSKVLASVGRFSFSKALSLVPLVARTWLKFATFRPRVLYYTAGSGAWIPFIRDFVFLSLCRPLFHRTLIHYHSGNLVEFLEGSKIRSLIGRWIYGRGAWTIRLGKSCPAPLYPGNQVFDVPNGIDAPDNLPPRQLSASFRILFLGNLFEDKGVIDLIDAVAVLASKHPIPITLSLIGGWPDPETRVKIEKRIRLLPANVLCPPPAPLYGAEKWEALSNHDVFAFPSYYSSENFPLVIIEAMAAGLPVVASDWRGIPSLIENDVTGWVVPPKDVPKLAGTLENLLLDPVLRSSIARRAHDRYRKDLTASSYIGAMRSVLLKASNTNLTTDGEH